MSVHGPSTVQENVLVVCYLRQYPVPSVVCIVLNEVREDILDKLGPFLFTFLKAAKLPCALIAVFCLSRYYFVGSADMTFRGNNRRAFVKVGFPVRFS